MYLGNIITFMRGRIADETEVFVVRSGATNKANLLYSASIKAKKDLATTELSLN